MAPLLPLFELLPGLYEVLGDLCEHAGAEVQQVLLRTEEALVLVLWVLDALSLIQSIVRGQ